MRERNHFRIREALFEFVAEFAHVTHDDDVRVAEVTAGELLHLLRRHRLDVADVALDVRERQTVQRERGDARDEPGLGFERMPEIADQHRFAGGELGIGNGAAGHLRELVANEADDFAGGFVLRLC